MYFSEDDYQKKNDMEAHAELILYMSYAILFLSALPCKIIGLELFGVLQLAYFSLAQM